MALDDELAGILRNAKANGFRNREDALAWFAALPPGVDFLILTRDREGHEVYGQAASPTTAIEMCENYIAAKDNPVAKQLRALAGRLGSRPTM